MKRPRSTAPLTPRLLVCLALCWSLLAPPAGVTAARDDARTGGSRAERGARTRARQDVPQAERGAWREGQLLVSFRPGTAESERDRVASAAGARLTPLRGASGLALLAFSTVRDLRPTASSLLSHPAVESAEPNYLVTADQATASDPRLAEQWALGGVDETGAVAGAGIGVRRAWEKTTGSPSTVVAVVDSGIDFTHPELVNNRWVNPGKRKGGQQSDGYAGDEYGYDFVTNSPEVWDGSGHGTAVAGLIAAEGGNGQGVAGVMWRASLMSLRVLDQTGAGDVASAVEAIDYAVAHGAHVINCSWGTDYPSQALRSAVERARARGVLVVASAGNSGRNVDAAPRYPASFDLSNVVSVASSDRFSQLTPSSNWGAGRVHLSAPGADLLTTAPAGSYREVGGTSAAAALVTGVAGLVMSARPQLRAEQIRAALLSGVRQEGALAGKVSSGGVLSASGALAAVGVLPPDLGDKDKQGKGEGEKGEQGQDSAKSQGEVTGAAGQGSANAPPKREPVKGRPSSNLPDLDAARRQRPVRPQAPRPVPSTLRNCPPRNSHCNGAPSPTPTPVPTPVAANARTSEPPYFATARRDESWRPEVKTEVSLLDYLREGSVTDASSPVFADPRLLLKAGGLLPSLFPSVYQCGAYCAQFVSQSLPELALVDGVWTARMTAGQTYSVSVTMTNTGSNTWRPDQFYRLGAQNQPDNSTWRLNRVDLPAAVPQNSTITVPFSVTAPAQPGASPYDFQWKMVKDGEGWFGDASANVKVTVTTPQFDGSLDGAGCSGITGWAWDATRPNTPVEVDIFVGGSFLTRTVADSFRADLQQAGKGDGRHAFSVAVPPGAPTGPVTARYANTLFLTSGSPTLPDPNTIESLTACSPGASLLGAPANLKVDSASGSPSPGVTLSWGAAAGTNVTYQVERRQSLTGAYTLVTSGLTGTGYTDTNVDDSTAYLYRVRAVAGSYSPYSNVALGTAVTFADKPLVSFAESQVLGVPATQIRAQHIYDLRRAVNAVRVAANKPQAAWTDSDLSTVWIMRDHVRELREKLNEALGALGLRQVSFTEPQLATGASGTPVRKVHIEELRGGSTAWGDAAFGPASDNARTGAAAARALPQNRTGGGGTDLLSGNFGWGVPLVSLPGRSGLDLGLSLSYNSLVWTQEGTTAVHFNADDGFPGPGFRLGFPTIQGPFADTGTTGWAYLLITPSGGRVWLRQVGTSSAYESSDSSNLKLTVYGGGSLLTLQTPDGSQLTYGSYGYYGSYAAEYRCTQVLDRNGNYLTVAYDGQGGIQSVTDTLNRTVTFEYDTNHNVTAIKQQRGAATHTWATFGYGAVTVNTGSSFNGLTVNGPTNQSINVLTQVGLQDGSRYTFGYNPYGQVERITRHSGENHELARTSLTYGATPVDGCPRVSQRRDWALDWNNGAEAVTSYTPAVASSMGQTTAPDGTVYRETYGTSALLSGLVTKAEVLVGGVVQKETTTQWEQDNTSLTYQHNPRVVLTTIKDAAANERSTGFVYYTNTDLGLGSGASNPNLAKYVYEYAANTTTVLRTTHLTYKTDSPYLAKNIVGLVTERSVYAGDAASGGTLAARTTYSYDETGGGRLVATKLADGTAVEPVRHSASYGTSYTVRGNVTGVRRWRTKGTVHEVTNPEYVESQIGYDTAGSAVFTLDPLLRKSEVSYLDSFADGVGRDTFAYPTSAADPYQLAQTSPQRTQARYDFHTGAVTRTQGLNPKPDVYASGPVQVIQYDDAGRVDKVELATAEDGAAIPANQPRPHTRYVYSPGQTWVGSYTTSRGLTDEAYSLQVMDGAGRAYASAADFPGSTVRYRATHAVYDVMGRAVRSSNPTEVTTAWEPTGDDSAGWRYSTQDYDWKGRPTFSTAPDGGFVRELIYGGCGCAGGETVTSRDALGRKQKVYKDVLGRAFKSEVFDGNSVYTTTTTDYDVLDRATRVFVEATGMGREALVEYDGHGRVASSKSPLQTRAATYLYNPDDSAWKVFTPREPSGATTQYNVTTTFTYNAGGQVKRVQYDVPPDLSASVRAAADVVMEYDKAGNRRSMTDGQGSTDYEYDALSRLKNETRKFAGILDGQGGQVPFSLDYTYNAAGALTSVLDKWNVMVGYNYDAAGQLSSVTGSSYSGVTTYAQNAQYRAWGGVKALTYGNNAQLSLSYTPRLEVSNFKLTLPGTPATHTMNIDYVYGADGSLRDSTDNNKPTLRRAYAYDGLGRLTNAYSGSEAVAWLANGTTDGATADGPFKHTYVYNALGDRTKKTTRAYTGFSVQTQTVNYTIDNTTGRNTAYTYDAGGLVTAGDGVTNTYDAAGNLRKVVLATPSMVTELEYDGDGATVKRKSESAEVGQTQTYYLRSSVLGETAAQVKADGTRGTGYVYAGGSLLATQIEGGGVTWQHHDPSGASRRTTDAVGAVVGRDEVDPEGVTLQDPRSTTAPLLKGGIGGGDQPPGGGENRPNPASLLDTRMCDFGSLLVPCGMVDSFSQHIDSLRHVVVNRETKDLEQDPLTLFWDTGMWYYHDKDGDRQQGTNDGVAFASAFNNDPIALVEVMLAFQLGVDLPTFYFLEGKGKKEEKKARLRSNMPPAQHPQNAQTQQTQGASQQGLDLSLAIDIMNAMLALEKESCRSLFNGIDPIRLLRNLTVGKAGIGTISRAYIANANTNATASNLGSRTITRPNGTTGLQSAFLQIANITINSNPAAAYNSGYGGRFGLSNAENRAITLIHELGHAANFIFGEGSSRIKNDRDDLPDSVKISTENSKLVFDNCFR